MKIDWSLLSRFWDPATVAGALLWALAIALAAWLASHLLGRLLKNANWVMGHLGRQVDETVVRFFLHFKTILVFLVALLVYASLVPVLRVLVETLLAGAGITALVVGLAARETLANIAAGISLAIFRPVRIGDKVTIDKRYGTVEDITMRHTIVRTWTHQRLVIPNAKFSSLTVVNHSLIDPRLICTVRFGISYDSDIDRARRLILEEAARCPQRLKGADEPWVRMIRHADFAIVLRLYLWVAGAEDMWAARWWLTEAVKKSFDHSGVEIPFPYRTVVYKKDLPSPQKEDDPALAA